MKRLIVLLSMLLLLAGAAGAGWYLHDQGLLPAFGVGGDASGQAEEGPDSRTPPQPPAPTGPKIVASGPGSPNPNKMYVSIGPLVLPAVDHEVTDRWVILIVSMKVRDEAGIERLTHSSIRLTDGFLTALYAALGEGKLLKDGRYINAEYVTAQLSAVVENVIGGDTVEFVAIQAIDRQGNPINEPTR